MLISRYTWQLLIFLLAFIPICNAQNIVINEFMADNKSTIQDEDGDFVDWIELYNPSDAEISLHGYHLSDDKDDPQKWTFPNMSIASKGYVLIFASGKDRLSGPYLHTNFKISDDGEKLLLSNSLEIEIDEMDKVELEEDESFGRLPDGGPNKTHFSTPTPGSSNNVVNQLVFSHKAGFYDSNIELTITSLLGDSIFYTLDGSVPTHQSNYYTSKITLNDRNSSPNVWSEIPTTPPQNLIGNPAWQSPEHLIDKANIIRCASFKNGTLSSDIYTHTFLIAEDVFEKYDMPIISLITDGSHLFDHDTGIYVPGAAYDTNNPQWTGNYFIDEIISERPIHIEFFDSQGTMELSQDAGVRIHGGKTRHASQKSLKLYARNEYGDKFFRHPLMPQNGVEKYERFVLQTTMGAWGGDSVIKDILAHEIVRDMDFEKMDYQPAVVFLNGEYWGIHHIRDRIDEEYLSYTTGLDIDSLEIDRIGNGHFFDLVDYFKDHIPIDNEEFEYISTQMDMDGFIDYNIAQMYLKNYDWPSNNSRHWRPKKEDGKWRWIFYDIDGGFGDYTYNMLEHNTNIDSTISWPNDPKATFFFRSLIENELFLNQFLDRYKYLIEHDFQADQNIEKLNALISQYQQELPSHIKRWHFPPSYESWLEDIDNDIVEFLTHRPCAVVDHLKDFFSLDDFVVDCSDSTDNVNDPISMVGLTIAPNPNHGQFAILNPDPVSYHFDLVIYDALGQPIYEEKNVLINASNQYLVESKISQAGVYLLSIQQSNYLVTLPFVVTRP